MKLRPLFDSAFQQASKLVQLHDELVTASVRSIRPELRQRFFQANLVNWRAADGLWRSRARALVIFGNNAAGLTHNDFSGDSLSIFLRAALALGMASVDKVMHEGISNNFSRLLRAEVLDRYVEMKASKAHEIALHARKRKGKGGKHKTHPGHMIKVEVMALIYRESFLSARRIEELCSALGKKGIFTRFGATCHPKLTGDAAREHWGRIYAKRNAIVHESDIIRMAKARSVKFNVVRPADFRHDIAFIQQFGQFLATDIG